LGKFSIGVVICLCGKDNDMKSLVINGRFLKQAMSGVQRFSHEILRAINNQIVNYNFHQTVVCAPRGARVDGLNNIHLHQIGSVNGFATGYLWEQTNLLQYSAGKKLVNLGNTSPLKFGKDNCTVIHDASVFDVPDSYSRIFRWYNQLNHKILGRLGGKIATVSEFSRQRISQNLRIESSQIKNISEGGEHILRLPSDDIVLTKNNLAKFKYFLVVGANARHKNLAVVYDVIKRGIDNDIKFVVTGDVGRPQFSNSRKEVFRNIYYVGQVNEPQLRSLYENAIALIYPSSYEGFGLPPLEAMYCGCPVIAAKTPSVIDVVGNAGLWFNPNSSSELFELILKTFSDESTRVEMGRLGKIKCEEYKWDKAAIQLLNFIQE
jgi:glycosyltransferase involved in cell wall biosynthesis